MKSLLLLAAIIVSATPTDDCRGCQDPWIEYKKHFNKHYPNQAEDDMRRNIYEANRERIKEHNCEARHGLHSYTMKENPLSDWTKKEKSRLNGARVPAGLEVTLADPTVPNLNAINLPDSFDYLSSPCLPAVKNQGRCGACWAFTATTPIEFLTCNKTNTPILLSESQLVTCSSAYDNDGCIGGWYYNTPGGTFLTLQEWLLLQIFLTTMAGGCQYNSNMQAATIVSYARIIKDPAVIAQALIRRGPLATVLKVTDNLNAYGSGVFSDPTCPNTCLTNEVNHTVVIVGFGTDPATNIPYWVVRNPWGPSWGEDGYFRIQRGVNMCNIECFVYFVTV